MLSDFGLATDLPDSTMVSVFVGTPHYMAPEVREGDPATVRSDVWSLGVVLHEIFVGRRPERRNSRSGASGVRSSSTKTSSMIERAMLALCERCFYDDPAERPADAREVHRLFENARRSPYQILRSPNRRSVTLVAATALVAVTLGTVLGSRRRSTAGDQVQDTVPRLAPTGEATDWSTRAKVVAAVPGRVHCFSMLSERKAQLIWGNPRHAEDIDMATGARKRSPLAAETYSSGYPSWRRTDRRCSSHPRRTRA